MGISTDSPDVLSKFREENDLQFTLLSDHDAEVSEAYGVRFSPEEHWLGFSRIAKRAAFLLDSNGRLKYAEVIDNPNDQPDFDAIKYAIP